MNKRGLLEDLQKIIVPLIAIGIVLVIGFLIMAEAKSNVATINPCNVTTYNYNTTGNCCYQTGHVCTSGNLSAAMIATQETQTAMSDIPTWLPIIIITIIGAMLIGLVAMYRKLKR